MNNYIEINADDAIQDFERQMLAGVNIPSLLPVNIINKDDKYSVCFITTGYKTIAKTEIPDIETLCHVVKSFVRAIITSEQYLLMGGKHFLEPEMIYYDSDKKEVKLIFGKINENDYYYSDTRVISEFIENLKRNIKDRVHLNMLEQIQKMIKMKNPHMKRVTIMIEDIERKWYCRNLIPEFSFSKSRAKRSNMLH